MIPTSHLGKTYRGSWGNLTDLYQLTMAYAYWKRGIHQRPAVFHLFFRKAPFGGDYAISAGLALVTDFLQNYRFSAADVQYLGSLRGANNKNLFPEGFLHFLQRLRFTGRVDALPEGSVVFPHQPMLRIEAPLAQAQLIESGLLNLMNFSTLIATKAARITQAAGKQEVLEFGLRRAQGLDGSLTASRAAFIGGCSATSNVQAGQLFGIPVRGTHAHSWVMVFEDELEAFKRYAEALPQNCVFLVDTYDTIEGVRHAIEVGKDLRKSGHNLLGIRLDSGDMAELSKQARQLLDEAGFSETKIIASNDLDETKIAELKAQGALIDTWGVGTRLITGDQQAALGGVYKLSALADEEGQWDYRIKLSEQAIKISNPGRIQVRRLYDESKLPLGDILYDLDHPPTDRSISTIHDQQVAQLPAAQHTEDLLQTIFQDGELVYDFPSLTDIQAFCRREISNFSQRGDKDYLYGLEPRLQAIKDRLLADHLTPIS